MTDQVLRFDGRVALVTGAGGGLGRAHALLLAARGARVVVNDVGSSKRGEGAATSAADRVVDEIRALGGSAVANHDSVEEGAQIVACALDHFGGLDIVVNNAGILRDASFAKMSEEDWKRVYRVHVLGAFRVTHAAWPHLRERGHGRVVMTTSAAALYGNFGQANYAMAKLGVLGLAQTLAVEGRGRGIHVNTIAPMAASRLLETVLPPESMERLQPEHVSPLVAYLCHASCTESGGLFELGGGLVTRLRWERSRGHRFRALPITPEQVAAQWARISDFTDATHPASLADAAAPLFADAAPANGNEFIDVALAKAAELPSIETRYDERDVTLYALGIGAGRAPETDLACVYEGHTAGLRVLPTFGVIPAMAMLMEMARRDVTVPGLDFGLERVLHGEQYTELKRPLPPRAQLRHTLRVRDIFDKGRHAVVVQATRSCDAETGEELIYNETSLVVRDAGGWGGERGPASAARVLPTRTPDAVIEEATSPDQALLYRLSGDWNPLHADPEVARALGFERPILHGLCTYGFAARHVIQAWLGNDPRRFKSIRARFAAIVYPGETLVTEMWRESATRIALRVKVKERDVVAISHAAVELHAQLPDEVVAAPERAQTAPAASPPACAPASAALFAAIAGHLQAHPALAAQTGHVYQWRLDQPESAWVLDLKHGAGRCEPGTTPNADCTLALSEADFLALCAGEIASETLFFAGRLKVGGNVMASRKLEFLKQIARPAAAPTGRAAQVFAALRERLHREGSDAHHPTEVLQFAINKPSANWFVDFAAGREQVSEGIAAHPTAVFALDDADLLALAAGTVEARTLYQQGRLRIDGDLRSVPTLDLLVMPEVLR